MTIGDWNVLAGAVAKDLDAGSRKAWAEKLRAAWTAQGALAAMRPGDPVDAADVLGRLGADDAYGVAVAWIADGVGPRAQALADLAWFSWKLHALGDPAKARGNGWLSTLRKGRSRNRGDSRARAVTGTRWLRTWPVTLKPRRASWAEKLRAAFAETAGGGGSRDK